MWVGSQRHTPAALPSGNGPGTHCIGGWVGPRAGLDLCGKSRIYRDSLPGPFSPKKYNIYNKRYMCSSLKTAGFKQV